MFHHIGSGKAYHRIFQANRKLKKLTVFPYTLTRFKAKGKTMEKTGKRKRTRKEKRRGKRNLAGNCSID